MKYGGGLASEGYYSAEGAEPALGRLRAPFATALGPAIDTTEFLEVGDGKLRISTHPRYVTWDRDQLLTNKDDRVLELVASLVEIPSITSRP